MNSRLKQPSPYSQKRPVHRGLTAHDYNLRQRRDSATIIRWACWWALLAGGLATLAWIVT